jgi:hypothetical protein
MNAQGDLLSRVGDIGWYHTIELGDGQVIEGMFDLTWGGFWAFEMERGMLSTAGFDSVQQRGRFTVRARAGWSVPHVAFTARKRAGA